MLNLNVEGVVFHAGKKRTIEATKNVVGQTFLKLNGHAYLVRLEHVKPVVRLTDVVRAEILTGTAAQILRKWSGDGVWASFTVGKSPFKVTRQDFEDANSILMAHHFRENAIKLKSGIALSQAVQQLKDYNARAIPDNIALMGRIKELNEYLRGAGDA